jgi:hypothetical protein
MTPQTYKIMTPQTYMIDYTVYEDGNNFMPAEEFTYDEAMAKVADLLDDIDHVREVTIRRVTKDH